MCLGHLQEEYSSSPDNEDGPVTKQPGAAYGSESADLGAPIAMPPPPGKDENSTLTTDPKPTYGTESETVDKPVENYS